MKLPNCDKMAQTLYKDLGLKKSLSDQPSEVYPNLYVGTEKQAKDRALMESMRIYCFVNARGPVGKCHHESDPLFRYLRFDIMQLLYEREDERMEVIQTYFEPFHAFVDMCKSQGKKVMIYCQAGAHRAGTAAVSYIMKE